jgi:hypothetical protein
MPEAAPSYLSRENPEERAFQLTRSERKVDLGASKGVSLRVNRFYRLHIPPEFSLRDYVRQMNDQFPSNLQLYNPQILSWQLEYPNV